MKGKILLVGYDATLLLTRATVLNMRWTTEIAYPKDVLKTLGDNLFDVVVLCHSLTAKEAGVILQGVRKNFPYIRILALEYSLGTAANLGADATAVSTDGPEQMFIAINRLLNLPRRRVA